MTRDKTSYPYRKMFLACDIVRHRCGLHTVTFSKSASEEVGDKGLTGLREGELPTLETYSGSGTYRTCKHNPRLYLHKHYICAPHTKDKHMHAHTHTQTTGRESLTQLNKCDMANNMKSSEQFHDNNTINTWRESDSHEGKSVFRNQRQM